MGRKVIAIGLALWLSACASFRPAPAHLVTQREKNDCTIAAVATLTRLPYEEVLNTFNGLGIDHSNGVSVSDVDKVLRYYSIRAIPTLWFNEHLDTGLLSIKWCGVNVSHMVYLSKGWVYDPAGAVAQVDHYKASLTCFEGMLLLKQEGK